MNVLLEPKTSCNIFNLYFLYLALFFIRRIFFSLSFPPACWFACSPSVYSLFNGPLDSSVAHKNILYAERVKSKTLIPLVLPMHSYADFHLDPAMNFFSPRPSRSLYTTLHRLFNQV